MSPTVKLASPFLVFLLFSTIIIAASSAVVGQSSDPASSEVAQLASSFLNPPDFARPWVYSFWVDGNLSREGITADLEAMRRVGIGGFSLMDVTQQLPPGPVRFNSQTWKDLFQHLINEAARLGLQVDMHNAPGWSGSGGPWINPELAMQQLVWSKTNFAGPGHFDAVLPAVPIVKEFSRDVAILAFPTLVGDGVSVPGFAPKITAENAPKFDAAALLDDDAGTFVTLSPPTTFRSTSLNLEFSKPFTASHLTLLGHGPPQAFEGVLQVSDSGKDFRTVREFISNGKNLTLAFQDTSARFYRLLFTKAQGDLEFSKLELAPLFRIELYKAKSGLSRGPWPARIVTGIPEHSIIQRDSIVNLTEKTDLHGHLTCDLPLGNWTILRFAFTPMGTENHPARPSGEGLECDKLSSEAVEMHFNSFLAPLIKNAGAECGKAFSAIHIDSWEVGFQNWTPRFLEEFQKRRGYDGLRFLPAFSGRFVDSPEVSERFLWDVRRTIADLVADKYAGRLRQLAHQSNLQLSIEAYDSGPFEPLQYASQADLPMGEFWGQVDDPARYQSCKLMASAAHIGGKQLVPVEAFTSYPATANWLNHPYSLKALADSAMCSGVNRFLIHAYTQQPRLDCRPGMTTGMYGPHYERTETWWEFSKLWHEYLARCQFLLQQGIFVADACFLTEESAYVSPPTRDALNPSLPPGFDYDLVSPEVVLNRMQVRDHFLILPDGMSYRLLVLPNSRSMTPPLLRKIRNLIRDGATVIGSSPTSSCSLTGFPACDKEVESLSAEIWGDDRQKPAREHPFGAGKIISGESLEQVFSSMKVQEDFAQLTKTAPYPFAWIHRRSMGSDYYFVANSNRQPADAECAFRITGKEPEFWHPDTGEIESVAQWAQQDGRTIMPVELDSNGSVFVVFRNPSRDLDPVTSLTKPADASSTRIFGSKGSAEVQSDANGNYQVQTTSGKTLSGRIEGLPSPVDISGGWKLNLPPEAGGPSQILLEHLISWSESPTPSVRYFSGTATYDKTFQIPLAFFSTDRRIFLSLGEVQVIAQVSLNSKDLGILWKPPFMLDVTTAARPGENILQLKVVNLWPNRMIGDEHLPEDSTWGPAQGSYGAPLAAWPDWLLEGKNSPTGRKSFATWKSWSKSDSLLPSGLLGPVKLVAQKRIILH